MVDILAGRGPGLHQEDSDQVPRDAQHCPDEEGLSQEKFAFGHFESAALHVDVICLQVS